MLASNFLEIPLCGSQFGQSFLVGQLLFPRRQGYFVDVGARCGTKHSNTLYLEQQGWNGICIEPHPDLYLQCKSAREVTCVNKGASSSEGVLEFVKFEEEPYGNSGILATFPRPEQLKYVKHSIIEIEVLTLTEILDLYSAPEYVEYLDIDTEGHEIDVLKGIDFSKYSFGAIGVETVYGSEHYQKISDILNRQGYRVFCNIGSDCFFASFDND